MRRRAAAITWLPALLICCAIGSIHASAYTQITGLAKHLAGSEYAKVTILGLSSQKRPIVGVVITDPTVPISDKARIVIVAGQHGNEPNSAIAVAQLAARLASDAGLEELRRKATFMIIPAANPDGLAHNTRFDGSGADPNRDWSRLTLPETRAIARVIDQWKPHLVVDEHEWSATDGTRFNCIESADIAGRGELMSLTRQIRDESLGDGFLEVESQSWRDRSLFHRHFAAKGYLAYLVETSPDESVASKHRLYMQASIALASRAIEDRHSIEACSASKTGWRLPEQIAAWQGPRLPIAKSPLNAQVVVALALLYCLLLLCGRTRKPAPVRSGGDVWRDAGHRVWHATAAVTPHGLVPALTCRSLASRRIRRGR